MREGWVTGGASRNSCPWAHGGGAHSSRQCRAVRGRRGCLSPRRLHEGRCELLARCTTCGPFCHAMAFPWLEDCWRDPSRDWQTAPATLYGGVAAPTIRTAACDRRQHVGQPTNRISTFSRDEFGRQGSALATLCGRSAIDGRREGSRPSRPSLR
jgi:hypothetical protein